MRRKLFYLAVGAALAAVAAGCGSQKADGGVKQKVAEAPVTVDVALAKLQPVQRTVDIVGTLEPYEEAAVCSEFEGRVEKVYVDLGDRVEKGRTIVKVDDEAARIRVSLAEASLREALARLGVEDENRLVVEDVSYVKKSKAELRDAEMNLKRMKDLEQRGFVSKAEFDVAQNRYDATRATLDTQLEYGRSLYSTVKSRRAELELAKKVLRDTDVRAPISGFVSKRSVDPGDFVKVGGELVRIVRVDPIRLRGEVPEVNAPEVRSGQEVKVTMAAVPGKEYSGRIARISPASSPQSRSFTVEVQIPNRDAALKPGYFAEAGIKTRLDKDAVMVPLGALVSFAGVNKVFVVDGGKAVEKGVAPGVRVGDWVEVSGDLKPGDRVVTTGMKRLYNGKQVSVRKQP